MIVVEFVVDFEVNLDGVAAMMDDHEVVELEVVAAVERGWLANYSALVGSDLGNLPEPGHLLFTGGSEFCPMR